MMSQSYKEHNTRNAIFDQLSTYIGSGKRVTSLDLRNMNLAEANLSKLEADQLDLSLANLRGANFLEVRLGNCNFSRAILGNTIWKHSTVRMCLFNSIQGLNACFNDARIEDSSMKSADLQGASFSGAKLTETTFERSAMQECIFYNAEGDGVTFRGADLRNASFNETRFIEADFRGADLRGANLSRGCFRNADFRGALLDGALLESADCSGAIFDANAEPYTDSTDKKGRKSDELDNVLATLLNVSLSELPDVLTDNQDFIRDITERLQQASDAFNTSSKHSPEEWKQWTESFLALAKDKQAVDPETIIEALYEGPIELETLFSVNKVSKDEILNRMRHLNQVLNSAEDEPPAEWKPILEPLIKKIKEGKSFDLITVIELLSS